MAKNTNNFLRNILVNFAPAGVLVWALSVLTASYFGMAKNVDAAFISSLVTTVLASYGITRVENDKDKKQDKDEF
jgi:putative effector of murein hydrolase LrgA (UPF0299 family)